MQDAHRVNRKILAREVRVIGEDARQLGVMPTHIACRIAEEKNLDLVEINPKAEPPVCKIIDYGRFKYEEAKKKRESKRKQTVVQIKEMKLRPKTDTHDLAVKIRSVLRFLSEGNKARLVIQFRGREIVHPEMGQLVLQKVLAELGDCAVVEQFPIMEGRRMNMLVAPKPGAKIIVPMSAASAGRAERAALGRAGRNETDETDDDETDDDETDDDETDDDETDDDETGDDETSDDETGDDETGSADRTMAGVTPSAPS